jgi:hypothetical protein
VMRLKHAPVDSGLRASDVMMKKANESERRTALLL